MGLAIAYDSFNIVPSGSYGVDINMGQLKSDSLKPGKYWKTPFFEDIYILNNNTIMLNLDGIGTGNNSQDQNPITADFRIHYKVNPKVGSIALNIKEITNDHGQATLKTLAEQSVNYIVGPRSATDTLADPTGFLKAFKANFEFYIARKNLPLEIDTIELKTLNVGGLRKVEQLRIQSDGTVVDMSGPAAVSVSAGGSTVTTQTLTTQKTTVVPGPTAGTAPVTTSSKPPTVQPQ